MFTLIENTPLWASIAGQVLIVLGALLFSTAAVGMIRLPDVYTRASAVSTAAGAGVGLIVAGVWFFVPGVESGVKVVVAVILQLITSAIGTVALARSAYMTGSAMYSPGHHDELADAAREAEEGYAPGWEAPRGEGGFRG